MKKKEKQRLQSAAAHWLGTIFAIEREAFAKYHLEMCRTCPHKQRRDKDESPKKKA